MTAINSYPVQSYHQHRNQHGQSAVEMALLLPIILLLLLGIIIAGFIFFAFIQVTNATREGARAGSVYRLTMVDQSCLPNCPSLDTTVKNAIYNPNTTPPESALGFLAPSGSSFNVNTDVDCKLDGVACSNFGVNNHPSAGAQLIVQVRYKYTVPIISVMLPMFPQPIVFSPQVTMELQ